MRRRSKLITQYLRTHDPLGASEPLSGAAGGPERASAQRPRVRRVVVGVGVGSVAITTAVAVSLAGWLPGGNDSLLSPQQAVAAVTDDLQDGQIVHWRATQEQINPPSSPLGRRLVGTIDEWANSRTGATYVRLDFPSLNDNPEFPDETGQLESWFDGDGTSWTVSLAPKGSKKPSRTKVAKFVDPRPPKPGTDRTPIDRVRRSLEQADRGNATISSGGTWHGVPVTKVTTREPQTTVTMWIARTKQPRLLKTVTDSRYPDGRFLSHIVTTTKTWQVYPASDEAAQRHVSVPHFDPAKYDVEEPLKLAGGRLWRLLRLLSQAQGGG